METIGPETETRKRGAYFVRLRRVSGWMGFRPISDDAPAELLERLEDVGRFWKGDRESNRVLFRQIGLQDKGLAVSFEYRKRFQCPSARPIEVAFEPVQLDESSSTLRELAALATGSPPAEMDSSRPIQDVIRPWIRIGIPAGFFIMFLNQAVLSISLYGMTSRFTIGWLLLAPISIAMVAAVYWIRNRNWFIVPGGVVVHRRSLFKGEGTISRFTPMETLLILQPQIMAISVSLIQGEEIIESTNLTKSECIALLGAWQSSIAPPELERLVDLR